MEVSLLLLCQQSPKNNKHKNPNSERIEVESKKILAYYLELYLTSIFAEIGIS